MYLFKRIASIHKKRKKKKKEGGFGWGLLVCFYGLSHPKGCHECHRSKKCHPINKSIMQSQWSLFFFFFLFFLHIKFWKNFRLQTMSRNIQYFILTDILQSTSSYSCLTWANPNACTALFDVYTSLSNCFIY